MELEHLYREIYPKMYAFFYANTSSREAAEDLTQDVFYDALRGTHTFAGRSSAATWLFGIARNKLRRFYRSRHYKSRLTDKLVEEVQHVIESGPEDQVVQSEMENRLLALIKQLDDLPREIIMLRAYGELSFREIGELVGITENHARVIFHRVKLQLHKEMRENHWMAK